MKNLFALVRCDCFERGQVAPTPLASRIRVDEEDNDLTLGRPPGGGEVTQEEYDALRAWRLNACPHPDMDLVHTAVGSWYECDALRDALLICAQEITRHAMDDLLDRPHGDGPVLMERSSRYGPVGRFATLLDELPDDGTAWGGTPPALARRMLDDLKAFERHGHFGVKFVLRDADSGEVLWTTLYGEAVWNALTPAAERWWAVRPEDGTVPALPPALAYLDSRRPARDTHLLASHGKALRLGATRQGFVVEDAQQHLLFSSHAFTQTPLPGGEAVLWQDTAGGQCFECAALCIGPRPAQALRLRVDAAYQSAADHGAVTTPLRRLCMAALSTGHPIEWHQEPRS
ncbi:hypothetical protein [Xenophilus azovorans]|uniref:hypothetical protein n=1 Tax=Xenophilus azovorans TaxID=151755 RepID=UPI00057005A6|nr:hypothetical protein [Xenophilus azovorans]